MSADALDSDQDAALLHQEVAQLHQEVTALTDAVTELAEAVRYLTNNLLDDEHNSELADQVRGAASKDGPSSETDDSQPFPELPPKLATNLAFLVAGLQEEARALESAKQLGEPTLRKYWENRLRSIQAAHETIELLEEEAVGIDIELAPYIQQLGGIPETLQPEAWPTDLLDTPEAEDGRKDDFASKEAEPSQSETAQDSVERNGEPTGPTSAEQQRLFRSAPNGAETQLAPYTLDDWQQFRQRYLEGSLTADQLRSDFARMVASHEHIVATLVKEHKAEVLKQMAFRAGCMHANTNRKEQNAQAIVRACLTGFTLGQSVSYQPFAGETHADAVAKLVAGIDQAQLDAIYEKRRERQAADKKALTDPETFAELTTYVGRKGYDTLSLEKRCLWDQFNADRSREARAARKQRTVEQIDSDGLDKLEFAIKEGFHDKKQVPLWIVQLSSRVDRAAFNELKEKAKEFGGWYSGFKKSDAGFQFYTQAGAEAFTGLLEGDSDRQEYLEQRQIMKMSNAAERIGAVAETTRNRASEILAADEHKLKNTQRRASMAAGQRAAAQDDLATAHTLDSLSAALKRGEAQYLNGIWNAAQVATMRKITRQGKWNRIRHLLDETEGDRHGFTRTRKREALEQEPLSLEDVEFVEYPKPYLHRSHLQEAVAALGNTPGVKQVSAKIKKLLSRAPKAESYVEFNADYDIELLREFLRRAKDAGYKCYWFDHCLEDFNRLRSANIYDLHELRMALRELLPHVAAAAEDDPVVKAEDALRGKKLPGFFPTPGSIIEEMLEHADIQGTDRVLEPSAGKGDILDAIRREHPDVDLAGVELNHTLQPVLVAKGYEAHVTFGNFLETAGQYDKIIANPPFENGQDIDHTQHAYRLLAPGGRLVTINCAGPFFRSDKKSVAYREWLDEVAADIQELPEDAFQGVDAFRETGVRTRLVVIDKADAN